MSEFRDFLKRESTPTNKVKSEEVATVKMPEFNHHNRKNKIITYTSGREFDFLKYLIIVEYYFEKVVFKDLTPKEIKLLLFLYSEPPFTRQDFIDYAELISWNKNRLNDWVRKGYIKKYGKGWRDPKKYSTANLYTLTTATANKIRAFYDKLLLRYKITEQSTHNPLFRVRSRSYTDKRYAKKIKQMNEGKYNHAKTEDDYVELNNHGFDEFVEEHNKRNNENLEMPKDVKEILKKEKEE